MFDPLALKRPAEVVETKTFTDPCQPGVSLELTMSASRDYTVKLKMQTAAAALERDHVGGDKIPITVESASGGRVAVEVTPALCMIIASLRELVRTPDVQSWSFEQWVGLSAVMPEAFAGIVDWASDLVNGGASREPGDEGPPVPNDSAERSEAT